MNLSVVGSVGVGLVPTRHWKPTTFSRWTGLQGRVGTSPTPTPLTTAELTMKKLISAFLLGMTTSSTTALAQCAMCRASISNSDDPGTLSASVNLAIMVMLIPTVLLLAGIGALILKYHRADQHDH